MAKKKKPRQEPGTGSIRQVEKAKQLLASVDALSGQENPELADWTAQAQARDEQIRLRSQETLRRFIESQSLPILPPEPEVALVEPPCSMPTIEPITETVEPLEARPVSVPPANSVVILPPIDDEPESPLPSAFEKLEQLQDDLQLLYEYVRHEEQGAPLSRHLKSLPLRRLAALLTVVPVLKSLVKHDIDQAHEVIDSWRDQLIPVLRELDTLLSQPAQPPEAERSPQEQALVTAEVVSHRICQVIHQKIGTADSECKAAARQLDREFALHDNQLKQVLHEWQELSGKYYDEEIDRLDIRLMQAEEAMKKIHENQRCDLSEFEPLIRQVCSLKVRYHELHEDYQVLSNARSGFCRRLRNLGEQFATVKNYGCSLEHWLQELNLPVSDDAQEALHRLVSIDKHLPHLLPDITPDVPDFECSTELLELMERGQHCQGIFDRAALLTGQHSSQVPSIEILLCLAFLAMYEERAVGYSEASAVKLLKECGLLASRESQAAEDHARREAAMHKLHEMECLVLVGQTHFYKHYRLSDECHQAIKNIRNRPGWLSIWLKIQEKAKKHAPLQSQVAIPKK